MVNGKKANAKDLEFTTILMALNSKVCLNRTKRMGMELRNIVTDNCGLMESSKIICEMDTAFLRVKMETPTKVNFEMTTTQVREVTYGRTVENFKAHGSTVKCTEKENSPGQMDSILKDTIRKTKNTESVSLDGQMVELIMGIGKTGGCMEKGYTLNVAPM